MNGPSGQGTLLPESPLPVIESYNVLRTNLQFATVGQRLRSLLITSSIPGEGKSLTAANLSIALAHSSQRVILVDGDLRRPRIHKLFHLGNAQGVTTALLQDHFDLDSLLLATEIPGLRVLTAGPVPPNPTQLLSSDRMRDFLTALQAVTDILIVDSPPATAFADAALLSTQVNGVLLVIDAGRTRRDIARKALDALKHVNAPILGVLLNRMPRSAADYYYYHYYYEEREGRSSRRSASKSPAVVVRSARKLLLSRRRTTEPTKP